MPDADYFTRPSSSASETLAPFSFAPESSLRKTVTLQVVSPHQAELLTPPLKVPLSPLAATKYYDSPAKQLLVDFLERYLEISFQGFQPGYVGTKRTTPDLILFTGPHRSTLAVSVEIMLEGDRDKALAVVRQKITEAEEKFRIPVLAEGSAIRG